MDCVVAILNYNGKFFLEKFLSTVLLYSKEDADVVIIDNDSSDDSITYIKKNFPQIRIIKLEKNLGFAGGYNEGLKQLDYLYYVLLNSDIEVTENWLKPLKKILNTDATIACVQPKILSYQNKEYFEHAGAAGGFIDYFGYPYCRGRILNITEVDQGQYDDEKTIFWTTGACMIIRKEVFERAGAFDADFFAHMEEIDLCWRIQKLGYICKYSPISKVYHIGGGTLPYHSPKKVYLNFRNNLFMLSKNLPAYQFFYIIPIRLVLDGIAGILFISENKWSSFTAVLKAHFSFYLYLPKMLKKRKKGLKIHRKPLAIMYQFFVIKKTKYSEIISS